VGGTIRRLLIAYDAGEPAKRALDLGIELAQGSEAEVGVVSVVPVRTGPPPDDAWSETSIHAGELHEAKERLAAAGIAAAIHEPTGPAGPAIVSVATEFGYDTIVIGARRLDPIRRAVLGSVSTYVARHAPMSVVIAR
jgi:nucleotide-binding universal stress UspA family protein